MKNFATMLKISTSLVIIVSHMNSVHILHIFDRYCV